MHHNNSNNKQITLSNKTNKIKKKLIYANLAACYLKLIGHLFHWRDRSFPNIPLEQGVVSYQGIVKKG